ncbi:class 1 fructose-bisphosphatase [Halorhabdus rudnickae]|uniref:class 1 fructose-bisphosphatase n=1 Tax=Halorhabdus rudnickae TaxID=1775544 RepID=UPI001082356C|nr:class 1 fructose-bisphosphatase [Halorhabdus rudnickae]
MNTIDQVERAVRETSHYLKRNLGTHAGKRGQTNPSDEVQTDADVWADELFFDALAPLDGVGSYTSEERSETVDCGEGYAIAIDPLDGSGNLASNNSVGTIVGIYDQPLPTSGQNLVAAMMVLHGPYTTMTVARADSDVVQEYLLRDGHNERRGVFELPADYVVVGIAGKPIDRSQAVNALAEDLQRDLKLRYGGATVADLAQVLEYGGLFGYPESDVYPDGKLRIHFEAAPLAYLVEAAGGDSSDGRQSLLEVEPEDLHARTPTFLGNTELIKQVEATLDAE